MGASIHALHGGGQPLDLATRAFFEPRFGRDLGQVRVHTGSQAAESARALKARAFTIGQNVVFGAGQHTPNTKEGRRLLAHELTHVVQQSACGVTPALQRQCDPASLEHREKPIFIAHDDEIIQVFEGSKTLDDDSTDTAVSLVQQALVDLGYDLGTAGDKYDGVDGNFGSLTKQAVTDFQSDESISGATTGVVDEPTLRCLDDIRSREANPPFRLPVFFPHEDRILQVFAGLDPLCEGASRLAVGIVQQALVDLGYDLGDTGPNGDGVDRDFRSRTRQAVEQFQADHHILGASPGVVDQATLMRLDKVRSQVIIPHHLEGKASESDFRIEHDLGIEFQAGLASGEREEDIYFARGSAELDSEDEKKIEHLAESHRGCALVLKGFVSEDERLEYGAQLAEDRLQAVDAQLAAMGHDQESDKCKPSPDTPLRELQPLLGASEGIRNYPERRKVEVLEAGEAVETNICPPGAPHHRSLDGAESAILEEAIDEGLGYIDTALSRLDADDEGANRALTAFFGGVEKREDIREKIDKLREHIDDVMRKEHRRGTACDPTCTAIAYVSPLTLCDRFFRYGPRDRALFVIHEASHASLKTRDHAYGFRRTIHFIGQYPDDSLKNTDSFVLLVKCLALGCILPSGEIVLPGAFTFGLVRELFSAVIGEGNVLKRKPWLEQRDDEIDLDFDDDQAEKAKHDIAWLNSWLTTAYQYARIAYVAARESRLAGRWEKGESKFKRLADAFDIHRPKSGLPTMQDQLMAAAIWKRYRLMHDVTNQDLRIKKGSPATWTEGDQAPEKEVTLDDAYFDMEPRARIEALLKMIVEATPGISPELESGYINFIR